MTGSEGNRASRPVAAVLVGLAATAVIAGAHLLGLDRRAELIALDMRFRHASGAPDAEGVTVVQIDDRSLEQFGRWPWPRAQIAAVADVLAECGAKVVALDIIMPEPQPTRYVAPAADVYDPDTAPLVGTGRPRPVFDDAVFERTLRSANVLLPMHISFGETRDANDRAADAIAERLLADQPDSSFAAVRQALLGDVPEDTRTPELERAARIYWRARALRSMRRFALPDSAVKGYPAHEGTLVPPTVRFAEACFRSGFVSFPREDDGVMRRIPLLARSGDDVYPHFALALAAEWLADGNAAAITAETDRVRLAPAGGDPIRVPVDDNGAMLIHWRSERRPFEALSAGMPCAVRDLRQSADRSRRLARLTALALARRLGQEDLLGLFAEADRLYLRRIEREVARQRAKLFDPGDVRPPPTDLRRTESDIERRIAEGTRDLLGNLEFFVGSLPADDPNRVEVEALAGRYRRLTKADDWRRSEIDRLKSRIAEKVAGRICLVGSTSTGAADFVPTPVEPRMPGVEVHAHILNTLITGAFVRRAPAWVNVLAVLLAGAAVALAGAKLPVFRAGPLAAGLLVAYTAGNVFGLFAGLGWSVALVAPAGAMVASFLAVTAYRQFTEERAKRHIRGLFAHALSPALVDRLIEDPSLARLGGERRELSCFFSDLAGFTPLSERLGEGNTVALLNRYFDRMTDVIQQRYGGYLNKFLGDGILGFFGAPVVQEDHPRRALAAAVTCKGELARLNEELTAETGKPVRLRCRIGLTTGAAMVGNCGSSQRMDYTAIGDVVNLASRLESANKQLGTTVLAEEATWLAGDDGTLLARRIGPIVVVGKSEPVAVWEVLGRREDAEDADDLRRAFEQFDEGVALFAARRFADAAAVFENVLAARSADGPAAVYADLCRELAASPPPVDWAPAIRLQEK